MGNYVFWLSELGKEHSAMMGKKCANLGEILKLKLQAPHGFAISVEAYQDFLSDTGVIEEIRRILSKFSAGINDIDLYNKVSEELRAVVIAQDIPQGMKKSILSYYRALCQKCNVAHAAVSTRSAGPLSRPGQYETYLNVLGEADLLQRIKMVWASSFNPRSLAYREQRAMPLESDPIGVAVLKMVNAKTAGVLFTADPNTGDTSKMIIEANWGLGESVVSGEAMPDIYYLNKGNLEVTQKTLGQKIKYVTFQETGITEAVTPVDQRSVFCLNDEEIREIGRMGKILEEHFGVPQDVEWAIDRDFAFPESVMLLQTRAAKITPPKSPIDQVADLMVKWL